MNLWNHSEAPFDISHNTAPHRVRTFATPTCVCTRLLNLGKVFDCGFGQLIRYDLSQAKGTP